MAEGAGLENRYTGNGIVGSNPTLSVRACDDTPLDEPWGALPTYNTEVLLGAAPRVTRQREPDH